MNGSDLKNPAEEGVKIYVPRSISGSNAGNAKAAAEGDDVKIYSRNNRKPARSS